VIKLFLKYWRNGQDHYLGYISTPLRGHQVTRTLLTHGLDENNNHGYN